MSSVGQARLMTNVTTPYATPSSSVHIRRIPDCILQKEAERYIAYDPELIVRYFMAPGTKVLLMGERDEQLHLDPVQWGYAPGWWDKPMLIYARVEAVSASRKFKSLCQQVEQFALHY